MTTRVEEINEFMLMALAEEGIEDTVPNRIAFLEGLQEVWRTEPLEEWEKDADVLFEKALYQIALSGELFCLRMKLQFSKLSI